MSGNQGGSAPLVSAGAGGVGGAAPIAGGGQAGATPIAAGGQAGSGGGAASGGHAGVNAGGVAGASGGMSGAAGSSSGGGGGSPEPSQQCADIEAEYASALAEQVTCSGGNPCGSRVEAAPGCDCRVFIQPKDPFAIEHLLNLQADWFDADCEAPQCPADCAEAGQGSCGADGKCGP